MKTRLAKNRAALLAVVMFAFVFAIWVLTTSGDVGDIAHQAGVSRLPLATIALAVIRQSVTPQLTSIALIVAFCLAVWSGRGRTISRVVKAMLWIVGGREQRLELLLWLAVDLGRGIAAFVQRTRKACCANRFGKSYFQGVLRCTCCRAHPQVDAAKKSHKSDVVRASGLVGRLVALLCMRRMRTGR